jgi:hypothetical protein
MKSFTKKITSFSEKHLRGFFPKRYSLIINGEKVFISNGILFKMIVVACETEMARLITYKAANGITCDAVQIHGGYGYMAEAHNEHFYRDAKALELFLEPCQIQRNMLADQIAGRIIPNHWKDNHQVISPLVTATTKHAHGSCVMGVL